MQSYVPLCLMRQPLASTFEPSLANASAVSQENSYPKGTMPRIRLPTFSQSSQS